ncbi:MAG: outer membrane beta-barrel protein [Sporocytophaga sp.]|uniref:outer membrane beta-barrel protein n=1 Tax=Sporocytophaga sp. TaxID=2231183 RepID=UPI001B03726D|nr:outer membrane beta-barrel protein [Sporocytophaga sp.]MBO9702601.1 outer membrane beta-barrel protein [Sporocytophaga sp.]
MKKIFILILTLLPVITFSQSIGIKGGINFSKVEIVSPYMKDVNSIFTPSFGLVFYPGISKIFDIGIEPSYSTYGYKGLATFTDINGAVLSDGIVRVKGKYIEAPITFNIYPLHKSFVLGAHIGVSPMFKIGSSSYYPFDPKFNSFLIAGLGGITLGCNINDNIYWHLTSRYQFTFNNFIDRPVDNRIKAFNTFLTVGHKF